MLLIFFMCSEAVLLFQKGDNEGAASAALKNYEMLREQCGGQLDEAVLPELALITSAYLRTYRQKREFCNNRSEPVEMNTAIDKAKSYLRQVMFLIAEGGVYQDDPVTNAMLLSIVGELLLQMPNADVQAAHTMFKKYCTQLTNSFGEQHLASSDCFASMAAFYCKKGDYCTALNYSRKVNSNLNLQATIIKCA